MIYISTSSILPEIYTSAIYTSTRTIKHCHSSIEQCTSQVDVRNVDSPFLYIANEHLLLLISEASAENFSQNKVNNTYQIHSTILSYISSSDAISNITELSFSSIGTSRSINQLQYQQLELASHLCMPPPPCRFVHS